MIRFGKIKQNNWERKQNDGKKSAWTDFSFGKGAFFYQRASSGASGHCWFYGAAGKQWGWHRSFRAEAEEVFYRLAREKRGAGGTGQNRSQEERRFPSGDSHFFLLVSDKTLSCQKNGTVSIW